ncbi:twin-arginine translocase subunit TatC [Legionella sp. 16cNR16C]|uniref:twin-arginine translocase subunit TatC n=1 Tax=Legionella sp. 16cNR16C TaxID=2905656 RepID=UPI001E5968D6|nr:twin-arginine translocase subunit TatC [Legionella sp. 16cNR16C]MCE3043487.1 twin-arginine translocase subunit TatC [Legionella sp. 16cNR16C]
MLEHLIELRKRMIRVLIFFAILFASYFYFAKDLFHWVVSPLLNALPAAQGSLIATQVTAPVLTPIALASNLAFLSATPFFLFQLWGFVAPGLYRDERKKIKGAVLGSLGLFFLGIAFCFYGVLPFMFQFFIQAVPDGVKMMPDISNALDFITRMLIIFGICFQVPLICFVLVQLGWLEIRHLTLVRPYIIVLAFTVGMLLTPPDVLSQILLAVPLCLLYELGILLCRWKKPSLSQTHNILS